jgi:hypothetical protein
VPLSDLARPPAFEHRMYFDYLEAQHRIFEPVKAELMDSPPAVVYLELHGVNTFAFP